MLTLCGQPRRFCDGVNRRDFHHVGRSLAMLAVVATWLLSAATAAAPPAKKGEQALTLAEAKKDADGFLAHAVAAKDQDTMVQIKVLLPDNLKEGQRYPVLYVLQGACAEGDYFGHPLREIKKHNLHNQFGLICVMPLSAKQNWYITDAKPTDFQMRGESFFLKVALPFVEKQYPAKTEAQSRLLLGFSLSGAAGYSLLLRHPDLFGRAAAWDSPMAGRFTKLLAAEKETLKKKETRLILTGYDVYRKQNQQLHEQLEQLQVPHVYRDGPERKHRWDSGWVEEAVRLLVDARDQATAAKEEVLFSFDDETRVKDWAPSQLPEVKKDQPAPKVEIIPAPKAESAPSGKCLKITFDGGDWPAIGTTKVPVKNNWKPFQTLKADLTVDRPSTAYFRICQATPSNPKEPRSACWEKTMTLLPGRNEVTLALITASGPVIKPQKGDVTSFIIGMFQPEKGQVLMVGNVRLRSEGPQPRDFWHLSAHSLGGYSAAVDRDYQQAGALPQFKVLGTDLDVANQKDLGSRFKDKWTKPEPMTIEQIEAGFQAEFAKIKNTHPKAIMTILRDGDKDPAKPGSVYSGWKIAYLSSHGPDGPLAWRETESGPAREPVEVFMRHRSVLMQADLASISTDATILAAKLAVTRVLNTGQKAPEKPNMWVAEPCNRDWSENSINCYFYAPGKRWKAVNGIYYGADPDFWPIYIAYGPGGGGAVTLLDFTEALKFWLDGKKHANHGFFLYGDGNDGMQMHTHRAKNLKKRPALLVIYEPKS